jgi:hypothetical protein
MLGHLFGRGRAGDKRDVSTWATGHGLIYTKGTERLFQYLRGNPYSHGYGTGIQHVAYGDYNGVHAVLMVFSTRLASGDAGAPAVTVALSLPASVPELSVRSERSSDRALGQDLQLESSEFNDAFRIGCAEPKFAYAVLNPMMMQFLLGDPRAKEYHIRYDGPMLVVSHDDHLTDVAELERMLDFGQDLIAHTARFVFDSGWATASDQPATRLEDIPEDAFGQGEINAIHRKRSIEYRGRTIEQADHIMDSRGMRDWFTVVSFNPPKPWPTVMITPKEFVIAASTHSIAPHYSDAVPTGNAAFDDIFAVGSKRPDFVHTVLTQDMMTWMLQDQRTRTVEIIFLNGILRPGRDDVTEVTNIGELAVSGLGTLSDPGRPEALTDLLCDVLERLNPAAYDVHVNPPANM